MSAALAIARLTLRETAARRLLLALIVLTLAAVALTGFGFSRIPLIESRGGVRLGQVEVLGLTSQFLIVVMFMFSFILALSAVFIATPTVSGDTETGVALALLARPIERRDFIAGKWLGLAAIVVAYAVSAVLLELWVVELGTGYRPPDPLGTIAFLCLEGLVLLTLGLALSTRLSGMVGGVIALVLFGVTWISGIVGGFGTAFQNEGIAQVGTISRLLLPTDGLWRGAVFGLEPASMHALMGANAVLAAASPFYSPALPSAGYVAWCVLWIAGMLFVAIRSFESREI